MKREARKKVFLEGRIKDRLGLDLSWRVMGI